MRSSTILAFVRLLLSNNVLNILIELSMFLLGSFKVSPFANNKSHLLFL